MLAWVCVDGTGKYLFVFNTFQSRTVAFGYRFETQPNGFLLTHTFVSDYLSIM